jgi:hypothetical protein
MTAGATVMDMAADCVWTGLLLSLTATLKLKVPPVVGVPEIIPLPAANVRPPGRLPDVIDHVYGDVPPWAPRFAL